MLSRHTHVIVSFLFKHDIMTHFDYDVLRFGTIRTSKSMVLCLSCTGEVGLFIVRIRSDSLGDRGRLPPRREISRPTVSFSIVRVTERGKNETNDPSRLTSKHGEIFV